MFPAVMPTRKSLCLSLPSSLTSGYLYPASGTPLTVCLKGSGRQNVEWDSNGWKGLFLMSIENYWMSQWRYYWRWSGPRVAHANVRSLLPEMPQAQTHLAAHCCFKCKSLSHGRLVTVSHTFSNISSSASAHCELDQHLLQKASPSRSLQIFYGLLIPLDLPFRFTFTHLQCKHLFVFTRFPTIPDLGLSIVGGALGLPQLQAAINHSQASARLAGQVCYLWGFTVRVPTNCQYLTICSVSPHHSILFQIYQNKLESFKFRK